MAIAVSDESGRDESGRLITFALADCTATAVADFAMWKGRSAATLQVTSQDIARWTPGAPGQTKRQGGLPLFATDGMALGGVGVSGSSSAGDRACGLAGIATAGLLASAPR